MTQESAGRGAGVLPVDEGHFAVDQDVAVAVGPADAPPFAAGEILVCRATTPAWTPLFARIAAVVTDVGSVAAHASIIAREYGIPAVVATGDGTARIVDGSRITVDGGAGLVMLAD